MDKYALIYGLKICVITAFVSPLFYLLLAHLIKDSHIDHSLVYLETALAMGIGPICALPAWLAFSILTDFMLTAPLNNICRKSVLSVLFVSLTVLTCWFIQGHSAWLGSIFKVGGVSAVVGLIGIWALKLKRYA